MNNYAILTSKHRRQSKILALVQSRSVANQAVLARQLSAEGIEVTQATLSRDLHELNLVKTVEGYKLPGQLLAPSGNKEQLEKTIAQFLNEAEAAGNLVVVKTNPGNAAPVARSLDNIAWAEIVGTVAGDDTVLVVTRSTPAAKTVQKKLLSLVSAA
ncbi:MAG: arginine repressor [Terriglobia bacterium]